MKRLLITGATGTLGFNITRLVAGARPDTPIVVAMRQPDSAPFFDLPNVTVARWDMFDAARTAELVRDAEPDAIVHCAAGGLRERMDAFDIVTANVDSTIELFRESCRLKECHFVHVSTGLAYREQGRPLREDDPIDTLHSYGASKAASDTLLRALASRLERHLTVVRPFSFTGIHDGGTRIFPSLLKCAHERRPFQMSSGKQVRDYCAVQDVANAILLVLLQDSAPRVDTYNVGSGSRVPLRDLVEDVVSKLDMEVTLSFSKESPKPPEPMHLVADTRRAQRELGWRAKTSIVRAVWELAAELYPNLRLRQPMEPKWQIRAASI